MSTTRRALLATILLSVVLFGLDKTGLFSYPRAFVSGALTPVQFGWYRLSQAAWDQVSIITKINQLGADNLKLRDENDNIKAQIAVLQNVKKENDELRSQLSTPETSGYNMLAAETLGFVPIATSKQLLLSVGSIKGVKVGQTVVKGNVVIGKITSTEADKSTVTLLTDPQTKLLVTTTKDAKGILVGQFQSSIRLTKVLHEENLRIGDIVMTSGEESWPKNFVVGEVTKIDKNDNSLFQEADIRPLVNYDKLQTVFILLGQK